MLFHRRFFLMAVSVSVSTALAQTARVPDVVLHSPYWGDKTEYRLPLDGKPTLVIPVRRSHTLVGIDVIRAMRMVPERWNGQLNLAVVYLGSGNNDGVDAANEQREILKLGLKQLPDYKALADPEEKWFEALGRPALPHALLVGADGTILARELLLGPLDWELQRIDAAITNSMDRSGDPPLPGQADEAEQRHPFYQAVLAAPVRPWGRAASPASASYSDHAERIDMSALLKQLIQLDAEAARTAVCGLCERSWNLTLARQMAEAANSQWGDEADWARTVLDSRVDGFISPSFYKLEGSLRIQNRSPDQDMTVSVKVVLRSRWDDAGIVNELNQYVIVEPASQVYYTLDGFQKHNAGWGDYSVEVSAKIFTRPNVGPRNPSSPSLTRKRIDYDFLTPRNENPEEEVSREWQSLPLAERALRSGFSQLLQNLEQEASQEENTAPAALSVSAMTDWVKSQLSATTSFATGPVQLVGQKFPALRFTSWVQGRDALPVTESNEVNSTAGKVLLIDFMFVSCPACRAAMPELTRLHQRYSQDGLVVLSAATSWGSRGLYGLIERSNLPYPFIILAEDAETPYFVEAYPTYVLVDRRGVVRWASVGGCPGDAIIEQILAEPLPPPS